MARVVSLSEVSESDLPLVGGKASKLGELVRQGLPVPPGFVLTTEAYDAFVSETVLKTELPAALASIQTDQPETIDTASQRIRHAFETAPFPPVLQREIETAYETFARQFGVRFCAVRSSSTAEDLEGASFAGLQDTYLNVTGTDQVVAAVRKCWGSLFTPRVLIYRHRKGFDQGAVRLAVLIQKMVDASVSGILFTRDPNTGENHMIVEAGWGLGEAIVGGEVTPDHYVIDGATLKVVHKQLSEQRIRLVRAEGGGNRREDVPADQRRAQKLPDHRLQRLVSLARLIESHYRRPMDVEWCGDEDTLYIVQARPVTTIPKSTAPGADEAGALPSATKSSESKEVPILRGFGASPGVAAGVARILHGSAEMEKLKPGEILVTSMTTPDMVPAMSRAAGIVTDEGGMTCHAAIVSRELGVPCIVGTREATKLVADGSEVTVDGKTGSVYRGIVHLGKASASAGATSLVPASGHPHEGTPITATKIYVNVGVPEKAEDYARLPVSGVGLLRIEFIFTAHIREHPLALLKKGKKDELVTTPRRWDRKGLPSVPSTSRDHTHVRLQDERVSGDARRPGVRARRGEPDDRMAGMLPLHLARLPTRVPLRARGHPPGPHRDGPKERHGHAAVRPEHVGARGDHGDDARPGAAPLPRLPALPHGRGPVGGPARSGVLEALRRVLDRVERPDPARPRRGP